MRRSLLLVIAVAGTLLAAVGALVLTGGDQRRPSRSASAGATPDSGPERPLPGGPLAGLNLTAYSPTGYSTATAGNAIEQIAALDASAVTLTPTWYMATGSADAIRPDPEKTPTDQSLVRAIRRIRAAGLRLILKPHVDVRDGTFRGDIQPPDRKLWFGSYRRFLMHYARIAAREGADLFVVGTELKSLSGDETAWRGLIKAARGTFGGSLTYAANWDEYSGVRFWDDLDLIGIDAYFPLAEDSPDPGLDRLAAAWEPVVEELRAVSERWSRPVLLTEVGYPSQAGATAHPWEVRPEEPADPALQARAVRAVFAAFEGEPWLAGINWWSWRADPSADEKPEIDYTPEGKPAEQELRREWGRLSG